MAQAEQVLELESEPPVKKSRKKLFVLLGAGLLLLGGAGAGAWHFLGQSDAPRAEAEEEAPKAPVFVRLDTFTVNIQPAEEERYLQAEIVLRVSSEEQAEVFKQHMPEVRNRLLILLSGKHAEDLIPAEGKDKLTQEIVSLMKKPLVSKGKPQDVNGVYFTSFIIQ